MRSASIGLLALALVACSPARQGFDGGTGTDGAVNDGVTPGDGRVGDGSSGGCPGAAGNVICRGTTAVTCNGSGGETSTMSCAGTQVCVSGRGCSTCSPGAHSCAPDGTPQICNADGTGYDLQAACPGSQACGAEGVCVDLCAEAAMHNSYIGCDYWTTTTLNSGLGSYLLQANPAGNVNRSFPFAVAVANPQGVPATVTVTGASLRTPVTQTVAPGGLQVIQLPWIDAIAQQAPNTDQNTPPHTVFATNSAYHVVSTVPVTVYHFNPLSYKDVTRTDQCDPTQDLDCFTFTNDASLVLPTNVLSGNVMAISFPTETIEGVDPFSGQIAGYASTSGFVTIVATQDNTQVNVRLTSSVTAGTMVTAQNAGGMITKTMNAGDVLQLLSGAAPNNQCDPDMSNEGMFPNPNYYVYPCRPVAGTDLTGSIITATHPVAVFGGHDCANVPYNRQACDHLEEEMFPNETLGNHYFVSGTQPQRTMPEPNLVRVVSNQDGNAITFTPASAHAAVTLARGEVLEFESRDDFEINGTGPFAVAQYFVGQNYYGNDQMLPAGSYGDPSMVLEVPVEQWRTSYEFLAPATYPATYVNVVAPSGATVQLDGTAVSTAPVHVNAYDVYRIDISAQTGAHRIATTNGEPFSIKVYGFGSYTSYMYAGGLDLTFISPPG